jgi:hypothetical protein
VPAETSITKASRSKPNAQRESSRRLEPGVCGAHLGLSSQPGSDRNAPLRAPASAWLAPKL